MYVRLRSARASDRLGELRHFYVDALGCALLAEWQDHDGYDGLVVGDPLGRWQAEFVHRRGHLAPPPPGDEHLLVFYVDDRGALAQRCSAIEAAGFAPLRHANPYWRRHGVMYRDPDGYAVVVAVPPGR